MLGIVMPVWLTDVEAMWQTAYRALKSIDQPSNIYIIPNRLHRMSESDLHRHLWDMTEKVVQVLPWDGARSVAGAWNQGIFKAMQDGCNYFLVMACDCYWHPGAINTLFDYMLSPASRNVLAASGHCYRGGPVLTEPVEGCDCTGFMLRQDTIERIGWFDERFKPAYYEDNDYCTRIVQSGHTCKVVPTARFEHPGSFTVQNDPEAAHHVGHWYEKNKARFKAKWGTDKIPVSDEDCRTRCFKRPWNDPTLPLSFCDRD